MVIRPITLRAANDFVKNYHRHHGTVAGNKFSLSLVDDTGQVKGVAICGRPVSRHLDNGATLEITRCCVADEVKNGCSMLYGACVRVARAMGYQRVITYTLESESGVSLKASGFSNRGRAGGIHWTGDRRRQIKAPEEYKTRWEKLLNERVLMPK